MLANLATPEVQQAAVLVAALTVFSKFAIDVFDRFQARRNGNGQYPTCVLCKDLTDRVVRLEGKMDRVAEQVAGLRGQLQKE